VPCCCAQDRPTQCASGETDHKPRQDRADHIPAGLARQYGSHQGRTNPGRHATDGARNGSFQGRGRVPQGFADQAASPGVGLLARKLRLSRSRARGHRQNFFANRTAHRVIRRFLAHPLPISADRATDELPGGPLLLGGHDRPTLKPREGANWMVTHAKGIPFPWNQRKPVAGRLGMRRRI
jgi:hypothetical protein